MATKQHYLLMEHSGGWQKPARRTIVVLTVMAAALVLAAPVRSEELPASKILTLSHVKHTSSDRALPCVPPQASRMEQRKEAQGVADRIQRNAGNPSLTYAMALSMALGVRNVAGPAVNTKANVAKKMGSDGSSAGTKRARPDRYALSVVRPVQCPGRVSMK